jgi:hypothetical protein
MEADRMVEDQVRRVPPSLLILATFDRLMQSEGGNSERSSSALPNGVVGSSARAGMGSSIGGTSGGTMGSSRTPGL